MERVISVVIGYAFGIIQSAFLIGKLTKGVDIRKFGSGNLGSTNALRVLGKKAGLITILCDISKSMLAFILCTLLFKDMIFGMYACLGVILGHNFPFYLKFKGGKGVASMIGMMFCVSYYDPMTAVFAAVFGIGTLLLTGYVSAGSLAFAASIPFIVYLRGFSPEVTMIIFALSILAIYKHKANIARLLSGTESKISLKKDKE